MRSVSFALLKRELCGSCHIEQIKVQLINCSLCEELKYYISAHCLNQSELLNQERMARRAF